MALATSTAIDHRWSLVPSTPTTPAYSVFTEPIEKPAQDTRSYRLLRLQNGLEAMLIHDKDADISAAALDVAVGHLNDPASRFRHTRTLTCSPLFSRTICRVLCVDMRFFKVRSR